MDLDTYFRFLLALGLVLALIVLLAWLARRYGFGGTVGVRTARGRRIGTVEFAPVDAKRRLVPLRRDGVEHLLLLGPSGDLLVESGIASDSTPDFAATLARREAEARATAAGSGEADTA
jgi:flagellar protein FliO/FliZ